MKKNKLFYLLLLLVLILVPSVNTGAKNKETIYLTNTSYNEANDSWNFTVEIESNKKIYYSYDGSKLDKSCSSVKSGQAVSVPAKGINDKYRILKLFTINSKGKVVNKIYYNIVRITQKQTYQSDLEKFVPTLYGVEDNDYIKAKKIYTWIGQNRLYKYDGVTNNKYDAFYNVTSACDGFAQLYADMCTVAGIECYYVNDEIVDYKYMNRHGWNHLYLDGELYYVDVVWSGVCMKNKVDYSHFANNSILKNIVTGKYDFSSTKCDSVYVR